MALSVAAVRGALGFLSRVPTGQDEAAWLAFQSTPAAFPLVGYAVGGLLALPLLVPAPAPTVGVAFVAGVYVVTGINHVDGVADVGDAAVVHGGPERRREVMADSAVGVGGALAVAIVAVGLAAAGVALAALPALAVLVVVAAEVGAKTGMALLVCVGSAPHEGLGSAFTGNSSPRSLVGVALLAVPALVVTWPRPAALVAGVAATATAPVVLRWARGAVGGVSGDVVGATNELARVVGLHAGVIAWTHW